MAVAGRVYLYSIALVALGMLIAGASGLLALVLETVLQTVGGLPVAIGESQIRSRASISGALTLIGLIAWLIHWWLADRATRRAGLAGLAERRSAIRKLFLHFGLAIGSIILTVAGSAFLADVLRGLFGELTLSSLIAGSALDPLSYLIVVGALELYYARVASFDRQAAPDVGAGATLRRWNVYGLAFIGLMILLFAAKDLLETLWEAAIVPSGSVSAGGNWLATALSARLGSLASGLVLWVVMWTWSNQWFARGEVDDPETRSVLRKVYLYLVLAVSIAWTVWNLGRALYEVLRALLIPERLAVGWWNVIHDLGPALAAVVVFGVAWIYHAGVVEREAALAGEAHRQASIRWIYGYLVALVGLATLAVGIGGTLSTVLDLLVQPSASRPTDWWQQQISLFATLVVVGLPLWTRSWARLQREAAAPAARRSLVRRVYLFLVFGLSVLTLLGSGVFTVYQLIRVLLGELWTAGQTSELITAASTVAVAALVLTYHLRAFRSDARGGAEDVESAAATATPSSILAVALVRGPSPEALQGFFDDMRMRATNGVQIELVEVDAATLERITSGAEILSLPAPARGLEGEVNPAS